MKFDRLGCQAALAGEDAAKDAHEAWLHGWMMAMEGEDKLENLKIGYGEVEHDIAYFSDRNKGFKAGSESKPNDDKKSIAWQHGWADAQS